MGARTVYAVLEETARTLGKAPALHQPSGKGHYQSYSWLDYKRAAEEIACGLRQLGIRKGDTVALQSETRAEFYLADLGVLAELIPDGEFVHGVEPTSIDAGTYGFIANIHFFDIDTPLKRFVSSRPNLVGHCMALHERVMREQPDGENR